MGVKKKPTLKILFRQFAISLIVMLVAAIIVPFGLEGLAVNAGLATNPVIIPSFTSMEQLRVKFLYCFFNLSIFNIPYPSNINSNKVLIS